MQPPPTYRFSDFTTTVASYRYDRGRGANIIGYHDYLGDLQSLTLNGAALHLRPGGNLTLVCHEQTVVGIVYGQKGSWALTKLPFRPVHRFSDRHLQLMAGIAGTAALLHLIVWSLWSIALTAICCLIAYAMFKGRQLEGRHYSQQRIAFMAAFKDHVAPPAPASPPAGGPNLRQAFLQQLGRVSEA